MDAEPPKFESARGFVQRWKWLTPFLEEQRERDILAADTQRDVRAFDGLVEDALRRFPPSDTSGMVEMQKYFACLRRRGSDAA